jgi:hypothetical protein
MNSTALQQGGTLQRTRELEGRQLMHAARTALSIGVRRLKYKLAREPRDTPRAAPPSSRVLFALLLSDMATRKPVAPQPRREVALARLALVLYAQHA